MIYGVIALVFLCLFDVYLYLCVDFCFLVYYFESFAFGVAFGAF